jgi:phosphate transport system substrate-binding protein
MIDGTTDIAMASRELKTEEKWNLLMKKWRLNKQVIIAYDALTVMLIQQTVFLN